MTPQLRESVPTFYAGADADQKINGVLEFLRQEADQLEYLLTHINGENLNNNSFALDVSGAATIMCGLNGIRISSAGVQKTSDGGKNWEDVSSGGTSGKSISKKTIDEINGRITTNTTAIAQNAQAITLKANQTTVDAMGEELESAEASIEINADAITALATRVTTAEGTITSHTTSIAQNAAAILLKASQSEVDELGEELESAEASIEVNADAITALATRVTTAEGTITSHTTSIEQNAQAIALKASQSSVDDLGEELEEAEASIEVNADAITALATRVTTAEGTITSHTTSIAQNAAAILLKASQSEVDELEETVEDKMDSDDFTAANIVQLINGAEVTIQPGKIDLSAYSTLAYADDAADAAEEAAETYATTNCYTKQSKITIASDKITIASGGSVEIESGGTFKLSSTNLTITTGGAIFSRQATFSNSSSSRAGGLDIIDGDLTAYHQNSTNAALAIWKHSAGGIFLDMRTLNGSNMISMGCQTIVRGTSPESEMPFIEVGGFGGDAVILRSDTSGNGKVIVYDDDANESVVLTDATITALVNGAEIVQLTHGTYGGKMTVNDSSGDERLWLETGSSGQGMLTSKNGNGNTIFQLNGDTNGGLMYLCNASGNTRLYTSVNSTHGGGVLLYDASGNQGMAMYGDGYFRPQNGKALAQLDWVYVGGYWVLGQAVS